MYFVYAISSEIKKYVYVGLTKDIDARLFRHNAGREKTTRAFKPFKLIFLIEADSREAARELEKFFKSTAGKRFLGKFGL